MFTRADVEKLGAVHTVRPAVLSVYLTVPPGADELPGMRVRASELMAGAGEDAGRAGEEDRNQVLEKLATCGRDWLGRTVALFASAEADLLEALPLPCRLPDRAVLGMRPHIRPLLLALQRCPAYRVVLVEAQHASMITVSGDEMFPLAGNVDVRDMAALLDRVVHQGGQDPLVVAGHNDGIALLHASLPPAVRDRLAGSFAADIRTLTPDGIRAASAPIVTRWAEQRIGRLTDEILAAPPGGLAAVGLRACLAAVNVGAAETLIVPDEERVPGYECGRCGDLSTEADSCPDWGTAPLPVPDVIEEMVTRVLEDGGQTWVICGVPGLIAARRHFPR